MNNTRLTNILLIILLIFNVTFLGKWWIGHRKLHRLEKENETTIIMNNPDRGGIFLVKTLGLDTLQQKKLNNILTIHYDFFKKYMNAYIRNQTKLFNALKNNGDSATAFRCADSLGMLKVAMEKELYIHFLSIKNICNSAQQKQYDELIDNISCEFLHHHDFSNSAKTNRDTL